MSAPSLTRKSTLSFRNLSFEVKLKNGEIRRLVDNVSVDVKAGELLAIMVSSPSLQLLGRLSSSCIGSFWRR